MCHLCRIILAGIPAVLNWCQRDKNTATSISSCIQKKYVPLQLAVTVPAGVNYRKHFFMHILCALNASVKAGM